jgi:large subunit ribosomal protein L13
MNKGFLIMDMNKAFYMRKEDRAPAWRLIDADGVVLGRLATQVADILRGKDKPYYSPHTDCGDYVVVINAEKIKLTGNKLRDKIYTTVSGFRGGKKELSAQMQMKKHPTSLVELAIKRMLPKNNLNNDIITKLKVYVGPKHEHAAQQPQKFELLFSSK